MDLAFSDEDRRFQEEVRDFLTTAVPADIRRKTDNGFALDREDHIAWQKILHERGWIAPAWPKQYGGCEWSPTWQYIFNLELGLSGAPRPIPFGLTMVGPVIYSFGNDAQKAEHLPKILSSDVWWCQGYSEPGAGSDLASLKMPAARDGDDYILNGAKIWTTMAHWSDWIFCLVRTSKEAKPQEGISFILVDMNTPGVTVSPIITIDGFHHVNQVTFEDVRVPAENLIGEEGRGWTYAKFLLANERINIADMGTKKRHVAKLRRMATALDAGGHRLIDDPSFAQKLADMEIQIQALEYTELRYLDMFARGEAVGIEPSVLKVRGTEIQQALSELYVEALGYYALPYETGFADAQRNEPPVGPDGAATAMRGYLFGRAATIYGGSNEIQRNILGKMLLRV